QTAIPWPVGYIGDRVMVASEIRALRQAPVEHVEQALRLHCVAIDGVFDLDRSVGEEVAKSAAKKGSASHLPEEPGEALGALGRVGRQEGAELLGEIEQDRARFEDSDWLGTAAVHHRRDL